MWLIGQEWKCSNACSGLILIGRGLDLNYDLGKLGMLLSSFSLFSFEGAEMLTHEEKLTKCTISSDGTLIRR